MSSPALTSGDISMQIKQELVEFLDRLAGIATAVQSKLGWFLLVGLVASAVLAWQVYSPASSIQWNLFKCGLTLLPVLFWYFIWNLLGQLREAPELAVTLVADEPVDVGAMSLNKSASDQPQGVRALFSALREFRQNEGLAVVFDTVGSVTLLANPVFALFAFVMLVLLMLLILITPLVFFF